MGMKTWVSGGLCAAMLLVGAPDVAAQQAGQAPPCSTDEYRQFDFWVGEWEVTDAAGNVVGENRITSILGGCVLMEEWTGASQSRGKSWNIYNRATGQWHQSWVDNSGLLLQLDGGLQDGSMVLEGSLTGPRGESLQKITWTPRDDGSVRQHWTSSQDGGATWTTAFDGIYRKKD